MSPRVSVVIPTYQRAHLLPRAVESVLAQTWQDFEVVVVDDGSTDATAEVVARWQPPRVRYVYQEHAGGGAARNLGAAAGAGSFLTFLDSDDEALPHWLETITAALRDDTRLVFCGAHYVGSDGTPYRTALPDRLGPLFNSHTGLFTGGAFLVHRALFEAVGGYAPDLLSGQHTELGFRLVDEVDAGGGGVELVREALLRYHTHGGDKVRMDSAAVLQGTRYLLRHHRGRILRHPATYVEYLSIAGTHAARLGLWGEARRLFFAAARRRPWDARGLGRLLLSLLPAAGRRAWSGAGRDAGSAADGGGEPR